MRTVQLLPIIPVAIAVSGLAGGPSFAAQQPLQVGGETDAVRRILERNSPVLHDLYWNIATPYRIKNRSPVGYYLGNGDATVTAGRKGQVELHRQPAGLLSRRHVQGSFDICRLERSD